MKHNVGRKKRSARPAKDDNDQSDSRQALVLPPEIALELFVGQPVVTLDAIAQIAKIDLATLSERYPAVSLWLAAVLHIYDPIAEFSTALQTVNGDAADELLRGAMRRLIETAQRHAAYFELALIEADRYQGSTLMGFGANLLPAANSLLTRIKDTGQLRPLPDWIVARALVSLFIGFIASERIMPQAVRMASRFLPQRAWIDGVTDILLYGLLEDEAR